MNRIGMHLLIVLLLAGSFVSAQKTYQKFADSEIKRFPEAWQLDHGKRLYFGYGQGLACLAMLEVWTATRDKSTWIM